MPTKTEEDYLKTIYHLQTEKTYVSTNVIATYLGVKPASVTDMNKKLERKKWLTSIKYKGCHLTKLGNNIAINTIRKHRLWETFLVNKLHFGWDEVHEIAEQLEHINSSKLIDALDLFLDSPQYDPHGDPIPSKTGVFPNKSKRILLSKLKANDKAIVERVKDTSSSLLKYLNLENIVLGTRLKIIHILEFDNSFKIEIDGRTLILSEQIAQNILVHKTN